jgi:hypothetical protein
MGCVGRAYDGTCGLWMRKPTIEIGLKSWAIVGRPSGTGAYCGRVAQTTESETERERSPFAARSR